MILKTLTDVQHAAVKSAICPGCFYKLPEYSATSAGPSFWMHSLSNITTFQCLAGAYREARANELLEDEGKK